MSQRVSADEVLARVNGKLEAKNQTLVKCQHVCRSCLALGDYYLMNLDQSALLETNVDLEQIARAEDCLADWEVLASGTDN